MSEAVEVASALAQALDHEDYPAAGRLLDNACLYEIRGETISGADAIIASYQANGEAARQRFDEIRYESEVSEISATKARIDYTDIITLGKTTHIHTCAQEIQSDDQGKVIHITHIDLPGQREMLEAFKENKS